MRVRGLILLLLIASAAGVLAYAALTPHDRYGLTLRLVNAAGAERWNTLAVTYDVHLRRGQQYVASADSDDHVFLDLFRRDGTGLDRVASAKSNATVLDAEIAADGDYVLRVHPALDGGGAAGLTQHIAPSLGMPVQDARPASIQSGFGAPRDAGARRHQGVDLFAPRGTPVVAAADGLITAVGVNGLGGNVVWELRPLHRESLYYAHLDTQLVRPGSYVKRGDVLGTVGNTGNARGGPTHLHFGIYAAGGAVDPLPYLAPIPQPERQPLIDRHHSRRAPRR